MCSFELVKLALPLQPKASELNMLQNDLLGLFAHSAII